MDSKTLIKNQRSLVKENLTLRQRIDELSSQQKLRQGLMITDGIISSHQRHVDAFSTVMDQTIDRLESSEKISELLLDAVERLNSSDDSPDNMESLAILVQTTCRQLATADKLVTTLIKVKKSWDNGIGLADEQERIKAWRMTQTKLAAADAIKQKLENPPDRRTVEGKEFPVDAATTPIEIVDDVDPTIDVFDLADSPADVVDETEDIELI